MLGIGGLYKNVKMSKRAADILVLGLIAVLVAVTIFLVANGGFVVRFDTTGGAEIKPLRLMYGETVDVADPTRQGYTFSGWYIDPDCTVQWSKSDKVTDSLTLYAGWK